jgi:hypothetical protein
MESLRFLNKKTNQNELNNFDNWWYEQIDIYGQETIHYSNLTALSSSNFLYGENPEAGFGDGKDLIVLLNLTNDSYILSKFGIIADSDMTGVIHPRHYTQIYGLSSEPKAGDLLKLQEFGQDRLWVPKKGPTIYELTEVIDEFQYNPLGGHYVWFFKAKRYDYSYEGNSPGPGQGNNGLNDNDRIEELANQNFDYTEDNPCSKPSVYGDY